MHHMIVAALAVLYTLLSTADGTGIAGGFGTFGGKSKTFDKLKGNLNGLGTLGGKLGGLGNIGGKLGGKLADLEKLNLFDKIERFGEFELFDKLTKGSKGANGGALGKGVRYDERP